MVFQKLFLKIKAVTTRRPNITFKKIFMCTGIFLLFVFLIFSIYFIYLRVFPQTKNILVLTTDATYENTHKILQNSQFRKSQFLNINSILSTNESFLFNSTMQYIDNNLVNLTELFDQHQFVLIGSSSHLHIPRSLPVLPKKRQVIGYTLNRCTAEKSVLLLPINLSGSLLKTEALIEFIIYNNEVLKGRYTDDEAFRIFTDYFSRRLLLLKCGFHGHLPPWEEIPAIDEANRPPISKPWGNYPKIPEIWNVAKELL